MFEYVTRRVFTAIILFLLISLIAFSIVWIPYDLGDEIIIEWQPGTTSEQREEISKSIIKELGAKEKPPFQVAYLRWMGDIFRGDFGESIMSASYYSD